MPTAIRAGDTWWYQLKRERAADGTIDPDNAQFELRPLLPSEAAAVEDQASTIVSGSGEAGERTLKVGSMVLRTLHFGLVDWRQFNYEDGTPVQFPRQARSDGRHRCDPDALSVLEGADRTEIANAILEETRIPEAERD